MARGRIARPIAAALVVGLLAAGIAGGAGPASASPAMARTEGPRPVALVYRGPASCPGCSEAVADLLATSRFNFEVRFVGPSEALAVAPASFTAATLYAQPGGDLSVAAADRALGRVAKRAIRRFVSRGGRYLGFCMGAYLAGSRPGMGLLAPGNTSQWIATRGASVRDESDSVIRIRWGKTRRWMYFQDGAYMLPSRVPGERVLARYSNGLVAALVKPHGLGRVGVVGPHPEADRSWYAGGLWRRDRDGLDLAFGHRLVNATMR